MKENKKKKHSKKQKSTGEKGPKFAACFLLFVFLLGLGAYFLNREAEKRRYPVKYADLVQKYAEAYNIPPALLFAVIATESSFDPNAVSEDGAQGLTQILPQTFHWLQSKTGEAYPDSALFEPEISIRYGAYFYKILLDRYDGDVKTAAAAYHSGMGQVGKWLADSKNSADGKRLQKIPGKHAQHYADKILKAMAQYEKTFKKEKITHG